MIDFFFRQDFEKGLAFHTESNGGEAYEIKELDDFVKNATAEAKKNHLTSCKLAKMYQLIHFIDHMNHFLFRYFLFQLRIPISKN